MDPCLVLPEAMGGVCPALAEPTLFGLAYPVDLSCSVCCSFLEVVTFVRLVYAVDVNAMPYVVWIDKWMVLVSKKKSVFTLIET